MGKEKAEAKKSKNRKRRGRGEGGVRFREDRGVWEGSVSLGYAPDGRRIRRRVQGETKAAVLDEISRLRTQASAGTIPDAAGLTVGQLLARWLAAGEGRHAPATQESRGRSVKNHLEPRLGSLKLIKLTSLHIEGVYADMRRDGVKPFAINAAAIALTAALNYAVRLRLIPHNPTTAVDTPTRPRREMHCLDATQSQLLLAAAKGLPCHPLLTLALATGCRQGELLGLYWPDLDLDKGTVTIKRALTCTDEHGYQLKEPKTSAGRRTISIPAFAVEVMRTHRAAQLKAGQIAAPVFCTRDGGFLGKRNVLRSLRAVIDRVNDPDRNRTGGRPKKDAPKPPPRTRKKIIPDNLRFHDLRHSAASILLSGGCSLRAVSTRLGHANPSFTLRVYAHCLPGDDETLSNFLQKAIS